jgi:hypothetical protein
MFPVGILSERFYVAFIMSLFLYGEELLDSHSTLNMEDHPLELLDPHSIPNMEDRPLMAALHYLFNTFTATSLSWRLSPQTAT